MTGELQAAGAEVVALEVDPEWAFALRAALAGPVATVVADALVFPWHRLPAGTQVAGNLPYNIATPLIERILQHSDRIPKAAFLVQKEVAQRLIAQAGDKPYGLLSVLTAARAEVRMLGTVKPGSFRPPPKVDSAFVGLTLHAPPLPEAEMPAFVKTVQAAFAQRRKTLQNNLTRVWPKASVLAALEEAALDPVRRAETLMLAEFLALHRAIR